MTETQLNQLKYPVGKFKKPANIDQSIITEWIETIAQFSAELAELTQDLVPAQLNWQYRPEGWNIKQVVHHCADSHMNSFIRFKLTLTEDSPTIRPYFEDRWAELIDGKEDAIQDSLDLIRGLHARWVRLLKSLSSEDLEKEFVHPEYNRRYSLKENIGVYAWHCQHHLAHIRLALGCKGLF